MTTHLHLSIGPVQTFVAQSRRTRDLWSSSYLLSFLAAHALRGATEAGGKVVRPVVEDDPMVQWVAECGTGEPPRYGSLPNQFTIAIPQGADPQSIADAAGRAFDDAWKRICQTVWTHFIVRAADKGAGTRAIWDRQVSGFWEFIWVAGHANDHGMLARRKFWRTHWLPEEAGDKCTLMPDFQELSGYVRATQRDLQDRFWKEIRAGVSGLELQEKTERLCAIAMVKRLYADGKVVEQALGWPLDVQHWASTVDVAAVPWVRTVMAGNTAQARVFADTVVREVGPVALTGGVQSLLDSADLGHSFVRLDANWFHRSFVKNTTLAPLIDEARPRLLEQLSQLVKDTGGAPIYYAMLLADGDRLGHLLGSIGAELVSGALARFTRDVPEIVRRYHGATIYAGGDDLLTMLPVEGALECAREIEQLYRRSFKNMAAGRDAVGAATISAAVVFAHARDPLALVLAEAHRLLDRVAKEENGRNSLGISVYRAHQCAVQWTSTWRRAGEGDAIQCVDGVVKQLHDDTISSAVVHRIARVLASLCGLPPSPGSFGKLPDNFELERFVRGELEQSLERRPNAPDSAEPAQLLDRLLRRRSMQDEGLSEWIGIDGLALAGFLAGGGREGEHGPDGD